MSERRGMAGRQSGSQQRFGGWERVIESALEPGYFIPYRRSSGFVEELEEARQSVLALAAEGEAVRAVTVLELFIAGCYEKAEETDDSDGTFGDFVGALFCDWIRTRQVAGADPDDTARVLLSWIENDDYGFCHDLEVRAVEAFDAPGLFSFESAVRSRWGANDPPDDFHRRRRAEVLRAIHIARSDPEAYAALCQEEDDWASRDCEELARLCLRVGRAEEALSWVDQGLEIKRRGERRHRESWDLPRLRRRALLELGRSGEALASAWNDFRSSPSGLAYSELMELAPSENRDEWHGRAMETAEEAGLHVRVELFIETSEVERLARTAELAVDEELLLLTHYSLERAAAELLSTYPLLAAKLHRIMAARILNAAKSASYPTALGHLERVRDILLEDGRTSDWDAIVSDIRSRHGRKSRFMPGFERLVAGKPLGGPPFLDRARTRWHRAAGEGGEDP
jgi:hypothetical protein